MLLAVGYCRNFGGLPLCKDHGVGKHLNLGLDERPQMSRGPGLISQRLQAVFRQHPEEMFTTTELCQLVYKVMKVQKKHRVGGSTSPQEAGDHFDALPVALGGAFREVG
jgi:hypothetical protein